MSRFYTYVINRPNTKNARPGWVAAMDCMDGALLLSEYDLAGPHDVFHLLGYMFASSWLTVGSVTSNSVVPRRAAEALTQYGSSFALWGEERSCFILGNTRNATEIALRDGGFALPDFERLRRCYDMQYSARFAGEVPHDY